MEHPDHVAVWLKGLRLESSDRDISHRSQLEDARKIVQPITPPRRSPALHITDDPSPITSTISGYSIFDTLLGRKTQLGTSTRGDESSDITSVDGEEIDKKATEDPYIIPSYTQQPPISPVSLNSHNPPSPAASDPDEPLLGATRSIPAAHNPDIPRAVSLTSCLQCTLADLPCSRTTPHCSRCVRNGHAATCLLTRRLFPEEIAQAGSMDTRRRLVLLKVRGENEEAWAAKMELRDQLMEQWQMRQDRMNWVFPSLNGGARGLGGVKGRQKQWGWEGWGRVVYEVLFVDGEVAAE